jgi:hypothetical protein
MRLNFDILDIYKVFKLTYIIYSGLIFNVIYFIAIHY